MAIIATTLASTPIISSFRRQPMCEIFGHCSLLMVNFTGNPQPVEYKFSLRSSLGSAKATTTTTSSSSSSSSSSSFVAQNQEPTVPPYNVLITGSTKGIGYALAKEFLTANDNVIICSRSEERVLSALERLQMETGKQNVGPSVMLEKGMMSRN